MDLHKCADLALARSGGIDRESLSEKRRDQRQVDFS